MRCPYQLTASRIEKFVCNSWYLPLITTTAAGSAVTGVVWGEQVAADEADPNGRTLIRLNAVILSLGMFAQIFCLPGLRRVVRSGTGALATLGLPTAHIHVSAKKSLDRAAFVLGAAGSIFMLVGIGELAIAIILVGQESLFDTVWYVVFGIYTAFGGSVTCMGLFTTYLGAELANQSIREVTLVIERTPPSSPEWAKVNTMVMTLARETLPSVSNAWGGMVACFIFSYALIAFANFVEWLYTGTFLNAFETFLIMFISLLVLWPFAATSSNCDRLMAALNDVRLKHCGDATAHLQIMAVETGLKQLNLNQGLGFSVGGTVMDKRKLKQLVVGLTSAVSPVFATVTALRPEGTTTPLRTCFLDKEQAIALQSIASTFNASCMYNVTVGADGLAQW